MIHQAGSLIPLLGAVIEIPIYSFDHESLNLFQEGCQVIRAVFKVFETFFLGPPKRVPNGGGV